MAEKKGLYLSLKKKKKSRDFLTDPRASSSKISFFPPCTNMKNVEARFLKGIRVHIEKLYSPTLHNE